MSFMAQEERDGAWLNLPVEIFRQRLRGPRSPRHALPNVDLFRPRDRAFRTAGGCVDRVNRPL